MLENKMEQTMAQDELHEECGVFGIYDLDGHDVDLAFIMDCSPAAPWTGELRYRGQRDTGTEGKSIQFQGYGACQ